MLRCRVRRVHSAQCHDVGGGGVGGLMGSADLPPICHPSLPVDIEAGGSAVW
jgi:hypothetical protein